MWQTMEEKVEGLSPREASLKVLEGIRHLFQSVDLPVSLSDLGITDRTKVKQWAKDAHAEQRLLSRCVRKLSVDDIQTIYENAF